MTALQALKNDLRTLASFLPKRYEEYDITYLADKYCDACDSGNESDRDIYLSALMLRFWYTIDKLYKKCYTTGTEREEFVSIVYECIDAACQYRAWRDPNKKTNAQACINQILSSRGLSPIYESNLKKNMRPSYCLDEQIDDESGTTRADLIAAPSEAGTTDAIIAIQDLINDNKIIEAVIADNIAFKDVFKHEKKVIKEINEDGEEVKYTKYTSEFWPFKLVQELNSLDDDYIKYFTKSYRINTDAFTAALDALKAANNQKKYKMIDRAKDTLKAAML